MGLILSGIVVYALYAIIKLMCIKRGVSEPRTLCSIITKLFDSSHVLRWSILNRDGVHFSIRIERKRNIIMVHNKALSARCFLEFENELYPDKH